jgi:hypothetical protein
VSLFHGTAALLRPKLRILAHLATWVAVGVGLAVGFLLRVNGEGPRDVHGVLWAGSILAGFFAPFLCMGDTMNGAQAGVRARREELLVLPLGRLAIPTAILIASAVAFVGFVTSYAAGVTLLTGRVAVVEAFQSWPEGAFAALPLYAFALAFNVIAIGTHGALAAALMGLLPWIVVGSVQGMGHPAGDAEHFAILVGVSTGAYLLLVPFALYARPVHLWSLARNQPVTRDGVAFAATLLALVVLGLASAGKAALVGGALVAYGWYRTRHVPRPARRPAPLVRTVHVLALIALAPAIVAGLRADHALVASAADPRDKNVEDYAVAPGGRWLAARSPANVRTGVARLVVADLDGKEPLRVLDARAVELDPEACWSRDGRRVAVKETAIGRFTGVPAGRGLGEMTEGAWLAGLVVPYVYATTILEPETGRVERRDLLEVAPGWTTPDQLVAITARDDKHLRVTDGRGWSAELAPPFQVTAYREGAVLRSNEDVAVLGSAGLAPISSARAWRVVARPETPGEDGDHPTRLSIVLGRGAERATVSDALRALWIGADAIIAETPAHGLVRVTLPACERTTLVADGDLVEAHFPRAASTGLLARTRQTHVVVELATGAVTPLAPESGFTPEVVVGTRVVGRGHGHRLRVRDGDGPSRPVFGP